MSLEWPAVRRHFLRRRWFVVALAVGSVLNAINQFDALTGAAAIHWPKACLTYAVPYWVSSLSGWFSRRG